MNRMLAYLARVFKRGSAQPASPMSMLDCEDVMRSLWDYLDQELTPQRMEAIRAHVDMCKRCYPQYEFERSFLAALSARKPEHTHPELAQEKLLVLLEAQGLGGE